VRRGVILAGGAGTRLHPLTIAISKQLLPVYDKPMIYYPLSVLMLAGVREILIISTDQDQEAFRRLLGDGASLGMSFRYAVQAKPTGLPDAFVLGEEFLDGGASVMILGDNIFFGQNLSLALRAANERDVGATIFTYPVSDPERYGVLNSNPDGSAHSIAEKPRRPKSNMAVTGLYFFDGRAPGLARRLRPSERGETEITDLIRCYLERGDLFVERLGRGQAWLDTGTHDSMVQASEFVRTIEARQGLKIGCIEEVAYRLGYIDADRLRGFAAARPNAPYFQYLAKVADEGAEEAV